MTRESLKLPAHVMVVDWAPQNDLLGHPAIKALVGHGGANSLYEAAYHAVPVVIVPQHFADQRDNALKVRCLVVPVMSPSDSDSQHLQNSARTDPLTCHGVSRQKHHRLTYATAMSGGMQWVPGYLLHNILHAHQNQSKRQGVPASSPIAQKQKLPGAGSKPKPKPQPCLQSKSHQERSIGVAGQRRNSLALCLAFGPLTLRSAWPFMWGLCSQPGCARGGGGGGWGSACEGATFSLGSLEHDSPPSMNSNTSHLVLSCSMRRGLIPFVLCKSAAG